MECERSRRLLPLGEKCANNPAAVGEDPPEAGPFAGFFVFGENMAIPRGVRNNNLGNIEFNHETFGRGSSVWK
jgi:hypothetical protein